MYMGCSQRIDCRTSAMVALNSSSLRLTLSQTVPSDFSKYCTSTCTVKPSQCCTGVSACWVTYCTSTCTVQPIQCCTAHVGLLSHRVFKSICTGYTGCPKGHHELPHSPPIHHQTTSSLYRQPFRTSACQKQSLRYGGRVQKKEFILCKRELEEGLLVRRGRRLGNVQQFCAAHLCSAIVNQAHYEPSLTSEQWVHFTRLTQCSVRKGQNKSRSPQVVVVSKFEHKR